MESPFSSELRLVAYPGPNVGQTYEMNDNGEDAITVAILEKSESVTAQQTASEDIIGKGLESGSERQNHVSRTFLLPRDFGSKHHTSYLLVVKVNPEGLGRPSISISREQPQPIESKWGSIFNTFGYLPLPSEHLKDQHAHKWSQKFWIWVIFACTSVIMLLGLLLVFASSNAPAHKTSWSEEGYIRYPTPGSDGPKRQLRILYTNATEWSQSNPHDNGEWKIRMDDQALIPAAAWDPEEDRYQAWFHDRYKVMSTAVKERSFIRPSWLGSLDMIVPWDDEFHLAHCVVTLKRYWKAKETGKHVCPRDIAPNHIEHCLNWFEGYAFRPEPQLPKMGPTMAWQTKVCF
ncbi:DUF3328 domain protein [Fusarium beomiforme]|uniref:DUF3328 domain protein n=1 Tax=Fusarium beomiforme TaxID=44412 RepID=A0A9P5A982_9HYPO|nr:DUF3328 domain protein [Fusarium beomiforme]